jgi:hypothetical protein
MKLRPRESGSVLIWVIWALIILSVFTVSIAKQVSTELVFGRWLMDRVLNRGFAKAGIERSLYELQHEDNAISDIMNENWGANDAAFKKVKVGNGEYSVVCDPEQGFDEMAEGLRYGICDEAARLNLNTADEATLKNLFTALFPKMEGSLQTQIAQALIDWRDEDDAKLSQGAEDNEYKSLSKPYEPRNKPFESVEEVLMVRGMTPEIYNVMRPYVTVYTDGKVNFNTAPVIVMRALGLNEELARRLVDFRRGPDHKDGTEDDQGFQDAGSMTSTFSVGSEFSSEDYAQIANAVSAGLITIRSDVFRIYSIGRLIRGSRTVDELITCVTKRDGTILYWKEGRV